MFFKETLKEYVQMPKEIGENQTTTKEFISLVNENTGLELQWFFDVYLYQNELPVLNVREEKDQNKLFLDIWWENKSFKMPIDISYIGIDGKINRRLSISNAPTRIALIQNNQYELDPDDWVLYKTTQN